MAAPELLSDQSTSNSDKIEAIYQLGQIKNVAAANVLLDFIDFSYVDFAHGDPGLEYSATDSLYKLGDIAVGPLTIYIKNHVNDPLQQEKAAQRWRIFEAVHTMVRIEDNKFYEWFRDNKSKWTPAGEKVVRRDSSTF